MRNQLRAATAVTLVAVAAGCARTVAESPPVAGSTPPTVSTVDCNGPSPTPTSTFTPPPTTDPSFWSTQESLDVLAAKVTRLGARFPQAYAGVALETEFGRLAVYRVPSAPFDAALRADLPAAPLRVVDAAHSARDLDALQARVLKDEAYWKRQGVPLNTLSALGDGSCVEVGTSNPDHARPLFEQRYGPAPIRLVHAEPAHAL